MSEDAVRTLGTRLCPWLRNALAQLDASRRSERLGHAWLIKGPAGTGKLNLAYFFAQRLLEGTDDDAPDELDPPSAVAAMREHRAPADHHPDLHRLFPEEDKRTIGVEQVRRLAEALAMKGYRGAAKAAIIEPAEAMTLAAANALLKTLEEPTPNTYLFLVAHQPDRLLPTIRSRCQGLAVAAPPEQAVADWLGLETGAHPVLRIAGRAPLHAAELLISSDKASFLSLLEDKLYKVSRSELDPRAVAEEWVRADLELALLWLSRRLEGTIRRRFAATDSKAVTEPEQDALHNAWRALPTRALLERRTEAEKLLERLGSGINIELALHSLLLSFRVERG